MLWEIYLKIKQDDGGIIIKMKINTLFFREIPVKIILNLKNCRNPTKNNLSRAREVGCVYSHYSNVINKLKNNGFLKVKKIGRENFIYLTKKGKRIAEYLEILNKKFENGK